MEQNNPACGSGNKTSLRGTAADDGKQETTEELTDFRTENRKSTNKKTSMKVINRNRKLLLKAITKKDVQEVRQLLKNDPTATVTTHNKETLLHKALRLNTSVQIIEELLHYGADIHALDSKGNTPLHIGVIYGENTACVQLLLNHGSNPNATNLRKETPMHLLEVNLWWRSHAGIAKALLHHGANVNAIDCQTETPLHKVLYWKNIEIIQELLRHRADIHRANSVGVTPLLRAMYHVPLAKLLVKYTLIHTFEGDSRNLFNADAYRRFFISRKNFDAVENYYERCVLELGKMSIKKSNSPLSLRAFVTRGYTNPLLFPEADKTRNVARENKLVSNYPIYSDVILSKLSYAWDRATLLNKVKDMVLYSRRHSDSNNSLGEKIVLVYEVVVIVVKRISNDDLCNLVLALHNSNQPGSKSFPTATGLQKDQLRKRVLDSPNRRRKRKEARLK